MTLLLWASIALVVVGLFFSVVAAIGLIRLPDLYTRAHATSKADTLGTVLTLAGLALTFGTNVPRAKLVLLAFFLLITNPTATHAITRAAHDQGSIPWSSAARATAWAAVGFVRNMNTRRKTALAVERPVSRARAAAAMVSTAPSVSLFDAACARV